MKRFIEIYLLPGAVLQSVLVGGGYGTGREIVEFFTRYGIVGGLLGFCVATAAVAVVFALSLELARAHRAYDYRSFFIVLLGPFWVLFELLVIALILLVIAVIGAAAGSVLQDELGWAPNLGAVIVLGAVVSLTFFGRRWVTRLLSVWSLVLYVVFIAYLTTVAFTYGDAMRVEFAVAEVREGWLVASLQYVFYNVTAIPLVLFAARAIDTRRQAFVSGGVGALIAVIPGLLLHLSFSAAYPEVLEADLPVYTLLGRLGIGVLTAAYLVVLFGTFVETGVGDIQGIIERVEAWWQERTGGATSAVARGVVAGVVVLAAGALSALGVVDLIASGYGALSWGFMAVYVLPLLTIGLWRIVRASAPGGAAPVSD